MNLNETLSSQTVPAVTVTPGASPYTYTAAESGVMYVSAGTVSLMQMVRGSTTVGLGLLAGGFFMRKFDKLVTTYLVAPTMVWVPL